MIKILTLLILYFFSTGYGKDKLFIGDCSYGFCEQLCEHVDEDLTRCYCNRGYALESDGRRCIEAPDDTQYSGDSTGDESKCDDEDINCENINKKVTSGSGDEEEETTTKNIKFSTIHLKPSEFKIKQSVIKLSTYATSIDQTKIITNSSVVLFTKLKVLPISEGEIQSTKVNSFLSSSKIKKNNTPRERVNIVNGTLSNTFHSSFVTVNDTPELQMSSHAIDTIDKIRNAVKTPNSDTTRKIIIPLSLLSSQAIRSSEIIKPTPISTRYANKTLILLPDQVQEVYSTNTESAAIMSLPASDIHFPDIKPSASVVEMSFPVTKISAPVTIKLQPTSVINNTSSEIEEEIEMLSNGKSSKTIEVKPTLINNKNSIGNLDSIFLVSSSSNTILVQTSLNSDTSDVNSIQLQSMQIGDIESINQRPMTTLHVGDNVSSNTKHASASSHLGFTSIVNADISVSIDKSRDDDVSKIIQISSKINLNIEKTFLPQTSNPENKISNSLLNLVSSSQFSSENQGSFITNIVSSSQINKENHFFKKMDLSDDVNVSMKTSKFETKMVTPTTEINNVKIKQTEVLSMPSLLNNSYKITSSINGLVNPMPSEDGLVNSTFSNHDLVYLTSSKNNLINLTPSKNSLVNPTLSYNNLVKPTLSYNEPQNQMTSKNDFVYPTSSKNNIINLMSLKNSLINRISSNINLVSSIRSSNSLVNPTLSNKVLINPTLSTKDGLIYLTTSSNVYSQQNEYQEKNTVKYIHSKISKSLVTRQSINNDISITEQIETSSTFKLKEKNKSNEFHDDTFFKKENSKRKHFTINSVLLNKVSSTRPYIRTLYTAVFNRTIVKKEVASTGNTIVLDVFNALMCVSLVFYYCN